MAVNFYKKSCSMGNASGCTLLGMMYYSFILEMRSQYGEESGKDLDIVVRSFKKSCDMGDALGCTGLGVMYENGEGVERNLKIATILYKKACDMGIPLACKNYERLNK